MLKSQKSKGFTLIELLIVIVIIGILAGVLIAIIDPELQQDRARNASVQANLNKMALAIGAFRSTFGRVPADADFNFGSTESLINNSAAVSGCGVAPISTTDGQCVFELTNAPLATGLCAADRWSSGTGNNCAYRYCAGIDTTPTDGTVAGCTANVTTAPEVEFRLFAKVFGSPNVYMYNSADSLMYLCGTNGGTCSIIGP